MTLINKILITVFTILEVFGILIAASSSAWVDHKGEWTLITKTGVVIGLIMIVGGILAFFGYLIFYMWEM